MHGCFSALRAAFAVLIVALAAAPAAHARPGDGQLSVLVMGDSYSAGNGAGSYSGAKGCRRSAHNYGKEFAKLVAASPGKPKTTVQTIACSGDTTSAINGKRSGRAPQINAVNTSQDLILLTLGGNDLKFAKIVQYCLIAKFRDGANCGSLLSQAEKMFKNGTVTKRLTTALSSVRDRADPTAQIVVLGYPYLEGDAHYTLRSGHGGDTSIKVGQRLRKIEDTGDEIQQQVVNSLAKPGAASLVFVNTKKLFAGPPNHELYAKRNNAHRWFIQPFKDATIVSRDTWYHPNPTGWKQEAKLLFGDPRVIKHDPAPLPKSPIQQSFPVPTSTHLTGITAGPDGNMWVLEGGSGNQVDRITPTGGVTNFSTGEAGEQDLNTIATGPDGALWFTGLEVIGRMTTNGSTRLWSLYGSPSTSAVGLVEAITPGPDGAMWYSGEGTSPSVSIGRVTSSGSFSLYPFDGGDARREDITLGSDGAFWFVQHPYGQGIAASIGRMTTSGDFQQFALPAPDATADAIAPGPDGALWFTEYGTQKIGRITTAGAITEYPVPGSVSPRDVAAGPDGAVWFTTDIQIGRITPSGQITMYPVDDAQTLDRLAVAPDGSFWIVDAQTSVLHRFQLDS